MEEVILTFVGAPDLPAAKDSLSRFVAKHGCRGVPVRVDVRMFGSMTDLDSSPPAPPRVAKCFPLTTSRFQDLPPVISEAARQGLQSAAGLRNFYLAGDEAKSGPNAVDSVQSQLEHLITQAQKSCNLRDYVILLIDQTIIRLMTDSGPPPPLMIEIARVVNPFLNQQGDDQSILNEAGPSSAAQGDHGLPAPFRPTDLAMITESEKDLLVLLYYCDIANLKMSPDEVLGHIAQTTEKYGKLQDLDLRKESFSETEVYIHWAVFYLTTNISTTIPPDMLTTTSNTHLEAEIGLQMSRLLTVCEMLLVDARLDQVCFILMFLRRCTANTTKDWWKSRTKRLLKDMKKNRTGRQPWHVEYSEKSLKGLKKLEEEGEERWSRRGSLMIEREEVELGKRKGD